MHRIRLTLILFFSALSLLGCDQRQEPASSSAEPSATDRSDTAERPNIVYILADDLGYADLSFYGSEIPTPNLDQLAQEGMVLTDFHVGPTCSPTRAMLMSGTDHHLVGLGAMGPSNREGQRNRPGYTGYLNFRAASLADLLSNAGYNTYMTGKWHLGDTKEVSPKARGFKRSFTSISGAAHLGGLSWDGPGLAPYRDGDNDANDIVHVDDDFYTTKFYTERMIEYIEKDRSTSPQERKPFFAYLAYTAPHWPLQAPAESIAKFKGWYDEGWEVLYQKRFAKMQELGFIAKDASMIDDSEWEYRWSELSDEEKRYAAKRMEIYAAMVSDLDAYVGEFIQHLKDIGEYDNTFIIFSSDNGAESARRDLAAQKAWVENCCDNSYDNLGTGTSYVMYGRDWATASTVAYRRHKATAFEGGHRVPAFVWYPKMIAGGQRSDGFSTIMDMLPTFMELAGAEVPGTDYGGKEVLPVKGRSILAQLKGKVNSVRAPEEITGWELFGHRGVRKGDWKISWDAAADEPKWLLFNLAEDQLEQSDLSDSNPEKLAEMIEAWDQYAKEMGVIYLPPADMTAPPDDE